MLFIALLMVSFGILLLLAGINGMSMRDTVRQWLTK